MNEFMITIHLLHRGDFAFWENGKQTNIGMVYLRLHRKSCKTGFLSHFVFFLTKPVCT